MTNSYIMQQRAQFKSQLADPSLHDEVCAMMITEDGIHPAPCLESLLNRTLYVNSHGWNRTLKQMIQGGFYGPYNRGMYPRTIAQLHNSPALRAKMEAAIASVMAGSDDIQGFTDQGLPTDPNGMRQPQLHLGGNIFNDWGGGPGGHDGAEAWRQGFEAAAKDKNVIGVNLISTARKYNFSLPYTISGIQDSVGVSDLKSAGLWDKIPVDLKAKLLGADSWFSSGLVITQADLDELPDDVWTFIASKLGLSWQPA